MFDGLTVAMVTPFRADGSLDLDATARLTEFLWSRVFAGLGVDR